MKGVDLENEISRQFIWDPKNEDLQSMAVSIYAQECHLSEMPILRDCGCMALIWTSKAPPPPLRELKKKRNSQEGQPRCRGIAVAPMVAHLPTSH